MMLQMAQFDFLVDLSIELLEYCRLETYLNIAELRDTCVS
jgi:hypothetical protein